MPRRWGQGFPKNKYKATRTKIAGRSFQSGLEAKFFVELELMQKAGLIRDLQCQLSVHLSDAEILYKPDFKFFDCETNEEIFAETKGFETPEWRIKRRLWIHYGPGKLRIYKSMGGAIRLIETLDPNLKKAIKN